MTVLKCGDCRVLLKKLPGHSIDSIVTDPPYELGFMGKGWDHSGVAYDVDMWRECLRVLKPGGFLIAFGGTRTYHRMACAIEDAGFEIRDSLHWFYGSGFPKSRDISKALDKRAGVEREVVGPSQRHIGITQPSSTDFDRYGKNNCGAVETAPTTPETKQWDGWGTALKPAHEPCILARKPFDTTVEQNVLTYGTGALNIDGCRIGDTVETWPKTASRSRHDGTGNPVRVPVGPNTSPPSGRWPANILFSHAPGCQCIGTKQVETAEFKGGPARMNAVFGVDDRPRVPGEKGYFGYGDANGLETVQAWECAPGCPVAVLDAQSGVTTSGEYREDRGTGGIWHEGTNVPCGPQYGDTGGASRFFYTEAWECVEGCPVAELDRQSGVTQSSVNLNNVPKPNYKNEIYGVGMGGTVSPDNQYDDIGGASRFFYCAKASRGEREAGLDATYDHTCEDTEQVDDAMPEVRRTDGRTSERHVPNLRTTTRRNHHPTVKPVSLMRYLCKLVTQPGGVVLDPFMGSGSTGIAAKLEGFKFIGFDLTPEYVEIARSRIDNWHSLTENDLDI